MSEKQIRTCKYLKYVEHLLILASTITDCDSYIRHEEFVSVYNILTKHNEMNKEIKASVEYTIYIWLILAKSYERNGIATMVDNDRILYLNLKYIEEGLDHKNLQDKISFWS